VAKLWLTDLENPMAGIDLVQFVRTTLLEGGVVLAPVLAAGFAVALVIGLLQSATGIHEPLVGMVPRLVVIVVMIFVMGGWMLERFVTLFHVSVLGP
jgi:flagellar biosynthetic protein FliQ